MAKIVRYSQAPLPRSLEDELRARLTQNPELPPHTAARRYEARSLSLAGDDCFTRSLARMLQAPDALFDEKQVPAREVGEPRIERKPGEVPPPSRNPDWRESRGCDGPSLSTSGETLTIEESMTLRARTENAGHVGDEHEWSWSRSEEHTSELQSLRHLVCRLLLE